MQKLLSQNGHYYFWTLCDQNWDIDFDWQEINQKQFDKLLDKWYKVEYK